MMSIKQTDETLDVIREIETLGVLGPKECPDPKYWHWRVVKPSEIPDWLKSNYINYGEIRFY